MTTSPLRHPFPTGWQMSKKPYHEQDLLRPSCRLRKLFGCSPVRRSLSDSLRRLSRSSIRPAVCLHYAFVRSTLQFLQTVQLEDLQRAPEQCCQLGQKSASQEASVCVQMPHVV
jgi:hypothetical protein